MVKKCQNRPKLGKIGPKSVKIGQKSVQNWSKIGPKSLFWNHYFILIILVYISMYFDAKIEKPVLLGEPLVVEQK